MGARHPGVEFLMTGSGVITGSSAYLRTPNGDVQTLDNGIALDPTHPGFKQMAAYYLTFQEPGFDF